MITEGTKLLKGRAEVRADSVTLIELDDFQLEPEEQEYRKTWRWKVRLFWNDLLDKHPAEQSYISKLDRFLLVSSMLGYFAKNLNQTNISTAYVNGMDEYFTMDKNQYNYLLSLWTAGYVLGQLPAHHIIPRINLRYFLGFLQLSWSLIMVLQFYAESLQTLYLLRFLLAILQAPLFISLEYLLGSWFTSQELSKRSTFLAISSSMASIFSGPFQQYIIVTFKDSPIPPFKWLFLFDAFLTIPIGIFTLIANPNVPHRTNNFYWSDDDKLVIMERRKRMGLNLHTASDNDEGSVRGYVKSWHFVVFPLMFYAFNNSGHANSQPTFISWMKETLKLPSSLYNTIPSYQHLAGVVLAILVGYISDYFGNCNHVFIMIYFVCMMIGTTLLAVWNIPVWLHWLCYFLLSLPSGWVQPQIFSWVNRTLVGNNHKRSFIVMLTNILAYIMGCWVPIFVWNTHDKPRYFIGFVYTDLLSLFGLIMTGVAVYYSRRANRFAYRPL